MKDPISWKKYQHFFDIDSPVITKFLTQRERKNPFIFGIDLLHSSQFRSLCSNLCSREPILRFGISRGTLILSIMNELVYNIDFSIEHFSWALNLKIERSYHSIFFYCRQSTLFQTFSTRRDILLVYDSDSFLQSTRRFFLFYAHFLLCL